MDGRNVESGVNGDRGVSGEGMDFSCAWNVAAWSRDGRVPLGMRLLGLNEQ